MANFACQICFALLPAFLLLWFFYRWDRRPEPPNTIWRVFALGVMSAVFAIGAGVALRVFVFDFHKVAGPVLGSLGESILYAALPEEFFKFLIIAGYVARLREFDEPLDGIVYGAAASLGFAAQENVMYTLTGGFEVAAIRALTAVPGHALYGAIMGYFIGQAYFREGGVWRLGLTVKALGWPILVHTAYNFPLALSMRLPDTLFANSLLPMVMAWGVLAIGGYWLYWRAAPLAYAQRAALKLAGDPARPRLSFGTVALTLSGAILATGGGTVLLALGAGLLAGVSENAETTMRLAKTLLFGVMPLTSGIVMYLLALQDLPKEK
jgi:RsiW-degrading membrane proteinase PrsW (M82 family)